ncbi:interleukin-20 receptor subunit alpha [Puntigrus tetrazona]|uniref:interleukin-20 receptor subunit alpha n=1 Tax=Puntigrus tetrazona TaxID=1606681 RepID=UPI001C892C70|nr:interleukin-20 receptor subunit alpha [Puntigrus tetrazona]
METVLVTALCLLWTTTSAERPPEPRDVHFYSENLRNLVRWTPGAGSGRDTLYTVEYAVYGEEEESGSGRLRWRRVELCSSVPQSPCDVSPETSRLGDEYYARVRALSANTSSAWSESSGRFYPALDTILGPPLLELTVLQNYVNVSITGPFRWRPKRTKKERSLWKVFPHMMYNVSVFYSRSNHTEYRFLNNGSLTLGPLDFSTQICVRVQAQSRSRPLACTPSEWRCVETSRDPFRDQLLAAMLGGVLPSALCLCVLAVLGGLIHCYVTDHRQRLPKSTEMLGLSERLYTFQPEVPPTYIFKIKVCGEEPPGPQLLSDEVWSAEDAQALVPAPVCYAQQNAAPPPDEEDSESVASEPPEHSEDGDYGIVLPAAVPNQSSPYQTQEHTLPPVSAREDEPGDQEQTFLDWSPETRELKIPLMGSLGRVQTEAGALLPNLILRQSSEESGEPDHFSRMERDWGLVVRSGPD